MKILKNLTPLIPLSKQRDRFKAEEIFVWRGGIKKRGAQPLLDAPVGVFYNIISANLN